MRPRYLTQHRKDLSEPGIVSALEQAGFTVWDSLPCDLLVWRIDKGFRLLEAKSPYGKEGKQRKRNDQNSQVEFLQMTGTPVVLTPEQALRAVGVIA